MLTAIIFVITLGVLIFVHELGHFWVARRNGIKADEFGFGFPPRIFGYVKDEKSHKYKFIKGNKEIVSSNTIYSLNWVPLGGFVKIKGENGEGQNESDSFASKKAWPRIKVLAAGVIMNFILAWALIAIVLMLGAPEPVETIGKIGPETKIQISGVSSGSPAQDMGLKIGDEIFPEQPRFRLESLKDIQDYIASNRGQEIELKIRRGNEILDLKGIPRTENIQGQGALGITFAQIEMKKYPFFEALWKSLVTVFNLIWAMLSALFVILKNLILGNKNVGMEVAGPVGIILLTKQVSTLGLVYVLQFIAVLSINLGLINILPIPALDGGRILFILIEKIKGSAVSQKVEQAFHMVGFVLLIALMILITFSDIFKLFK